MYRKIASTISSVCLSPSSVTSTCSPNEENEVLELSGPALSAVAQPFFLRNDKIEPIAVVAGRGRRRRRRRKNAQVNEH